MLCRLRRVLHRLPLILTLIGVFGLASCKHASRLEGRWRGDHAEGVAPELQKAADDFAKRMEVVFQGERLTVVIGTSSQSGAFHVDNEDSTSIILHTDRDGVNDKQQFTITGEKTIRWSVLEGKAIAFVKQ